MKRAECILTPGLAAGTSELFVGIDIAATTAEVSTQRPGAQAGRSFKIDQTPEGFHRLVHTLQAPENDPSHVLVVMEAPGSYGLSLATRLVHEGFRVSVINPSQAHHFAQALLKRAKTDAIDAQTLAQLAMVLQPEPWMPPPQIYYEVQQRLAPRDDLLNLRQQVRNQLHALEQHPEVIASVRTRMERLLDSYYRIFSSAAPWRDYRRYGAVWAVDPGSPTYLRNLPAQPETVGICG